MAIGNLDNAAAAQALITSLTTNEGQFRNGMDQVLTQVDNNDTRLDTLEANDLTDGGAVAGSITISDDLAVGDSITHNGSFGAFPSTINNSGSVTLQQSHTTIFHTGTGTVTIATDGMTPEGATFNVTTTGTLTMTYPSGARGVSIGNSAQLVSGVFRSGVGIFFSETVAPST